MGLAGTVAVVTGAARGIGWAIANALVARGAITILTDVTPFGPAARALAAAHPDAVRLSTMDVSSAASVQHAVEAIAAEFGRIGVLVNNAGIEFYEPVTSTTEEQWDRLMGVNLKGVFLCSKAVIPHMRKSGGSIVNVASELGLVGEANVAAYCASKGGVVMLSKAMAIDHAADGIRVNCLCPGPIATELMQGVFDASGDAEGMRLGFEKQILLGRLGSPAEVARAAVFLASDDSSFMTGANLVLDGGWTAR